MPLHRQNQRTLKTACRCLSVVLLTTLPGCVRSTEHVTLTIWSAPTGVEEKAFVTLCRRFDLEHPDIRIHNVGSLREENLIRAIVAACPPDLAYIYGTSDLGPLAANGAVTPLDGAFKASGLTESDFLSSALEQGRFRGQLYAMPVTRDCQCFYWNRTIFRRAGLDPDRPPQTLEELRRLALDLTQRRPDGSLARLGFMPIPDDPVTILAALGVELYDRASGGITLNQPKNVAALKWLVQLIDDLGGRSAVAGFKSTFGRTDSAQNPLAMGKVAMEIDGEWIAMRLEKFAPELDYGVGEIPHPANRPELQNMAWQDGDIMVIPAGSKHPAAAWEFIRWMQMPRQQEEYAAAMNNLPAIRALLNSPAITSGSPSKRSLGYVLRHIAGGTKNPRFFPTLPISRLYRDVLVNAIEVAELHQKTPEQALNDAQEQVEKELLKYAK